MSIFTTIEGYLAAALAPMTTRVLTGQDEDGKPTRTVIPGALRSLRVTSGDMRAVNKFYADARPAGLIMRDGFTIDDDRGRLTANYRLTLIDDTCRDEGEAGGPGELTLDDLAEMAVALLTDAAWDRHRVRARLTGGQTVRDDVSGEWEHSINVQVTAEWRPTPRALASRVAPVSAE